MRCDPCICYVHLCVAIAKALNKTLNDLFWEESDHER